MTTTYAATTDDWQVIDDKIKAFRDTLGGDEEESLGTCDRALEGEIDAIEKVMGWMEEPMPPKTVTPPADYVQKNKKIIRGIDERSAIALGRAIDISTRALSMGLTRDRVVSIWRARGVGFVLSDALVP